MNQRDSGPGEHIDKPGCHGESLRIDNGFGVRSFEIADTNDPIATNRDVGMLRLGTSAVVKRAVSNDDVEICPPWWWGSPLRKHREHNCHEHAEPKKNPSHYVAGRY